MQQTARRLLTTAAIKLGISNPLVRMLIRSQCARHGASLLQRDRQTLALIKGARAMLIAPRHFAFAPEMAEKFDFYFDPLQSHLRDGFETIDFSRPGILQTYRDSGLQFEMASFPEEQFAIDSYFHWYTPQAGDLIFDLGAHCGVSTYHFSKAVGDNGRVVAFEPDPTNFAILENNMRFHRLTNVTCIQLAIASGRGTVRFNAEGTIGSAIAGATSRATLGRIIDVQTIGLTDAFAEFGTPQFCKIDIEGAEIEAVAAALPAIRDRRIQFALDTMHRVDGKFSTQRVEDLFRQVGYESASSTGTFATTWARPPVLSNVPADRSVAGN